RWCVGVGDHLAHQASARASLGDPRHRVHHHRHAAALRRAARAAPAHHGDRHDLHPESRRIQPGVRTGQFEPRLGDGSDRRTARLRRVVRIPAIRQPKGEPRMVTATRNVTRALTVGDNAPRRRRQPAGPSVYAVNLVLIVAAVYFLLPLIWVIIAATKSPADLFGTFGLWFSDPPAAWHNLVALFTQDGGVFTRWLVNSVIYSGLGAFVAMVLAAACGYAIAKYPFRGREALFSVILGGVLV